MGYHAKANGIGSNIDIRKWTFNKQKDWKFIKHKDFLLLFLQQLTIII